MIAILDVHYHDDAGAAACVLIDRWTDATARDELTERVAPVEPYVPGQFYRRELPCLLAVLRKAPPALEAIVVDGHVWLGATGSPGLGAHLHAALREATPIIGVAKTPYAGTPPHVAAPLLRGTSRQPLYVSATGLSLEVAVDHIRAMPGLHRLPELLKRADQLARLTISR